MADPIKPGDVVELKSGGPAMTVESISDSGKTVYCIWYVRGTANYPPEIRTQECSVTAVRQSPKGKGEAAAD